MAFRTDGRMENVIVPLERGIQSRITTPGKRKQQHNQHPKQQSVDALIVRRNL